MSKLSSSINRDLIIFMLFRFLMDDAEFTLVCLKQSKNSN